MNKSVTCSMIVIALFALYAGSFTLRASQRELETGTISVKRYWHCAENPKKYNCTSREVKASKSFLAGATVATIAAKLRAAKLKVTKQQIETVKGTDDKVMVSKPTKPSKKPTRMPVMETKS